MAREIHILRRLDHPNIIKLEGLVTSRMSCSLYLVFKYMEHDLAGLASPPAVKFTEPQYPPSKEFDAKMRDEEARRQGAAGGRGQRADPEKKVTRESRAIPAPDANAELVLSMRKRQASAKSCSEMFNNHQEEVAYGFPFGPPRASHAAEQPCTNRQPLQHKRASYSEPLVNQLAWAKTGKNLDANLKASNGADSSTMTSSVASRRSLLNENKRERTGSFHAAVPKLIAWFPGSFKEASESMAKARISGSHATIFKFSPK